MFLLVGGVIMLAVPNVLSEHPGNGNKNGNGVATKRPLDRLPDTFVDVFKAGQGGKPTRGTMGATCWARGGICVDIRQCPKLRMDVGIAGCSWGYKVCCIVHAGVHRRFSVPVINNLDELGTSLEILALRNSLLLSNWQSDLQKPENDEIH